MKQHTSRRAIAGLIAALLLLSPASADPVQAPSPVGDWTFITGKMSSGCVLGGEMSVTRKAANSFSCRFTAKWTCQTGPSRVVETRQTCTAKQAGEAIEITSKMEKVTRVDPPGLTAWMQENYAADHFKVKINPHADEMRGRFHSWGEAQVIFRRKIELIG